MRPRRTFFDTNVIFYAFDGSDLEKQRRAKELLDAAGNDLIVSTQVLQELFNSLTKKRKLTPEGARAVIDGLLTGTVATLTGEQVLAAIDLSIRSGYSLWDSLIIEAAVTAKCDRILTEDMQHGQVIKGIRIENPFL